MIEYVGASRLDPRSFPVLQGSCVLVWLLLVPEIKSLLTIRSVSVVTLPMGYVEIPVRFLNMVKWTANPVPFLHSRCGEWRPLTDWYHAVAASRSDVH